MDAAAINGVRPYAFSAMLGSPFAFSNDCTQCKNTTPHTSHTSWLDTGEVKWPPCANTLAMATWLNLQASRSGVLPLFLTSTKLGSAPAFSNMSAVSPWPSAVACTSAELFMLCSAFFAAAASSSPFFLALRATRWCGVKLLACYRVVVWSGCEAA